MVLNLLDTILSQQERMNLDKEYLRGVDPDDINVIMIGGTKEDTEATPVIMDGALVGFTVKTHTVAASKKVIPLKLVGIKKSVTTDKDVVLSVTETAAVKISASLMSGERRIEENYPFSDHEFATAKVINLYFVTEVGAAALVMDAYFIGIEIPA